MRLEGHAKRLAEALSGRFDRLRDDSIHESPHLFL